MKNQLLSSVDTHNQRCYSGIDMAIELFEATSKVKSLLFFPTRDAKLAKTIHSRLFELSKENKKLSVEQFSHWIEERNIRYSGATRVTSLYAAIEMVKELLNEERKTELTLLPFNLPTNEKRKATNFKASFTTIKNGSGVKEKTWLDSFTI
jgi:hypothetical protein